MITREQAVALYGGSVAALAKDLGYTSRHAVYMWDKADPIPEAAYLKLRYQLKPEAFDAKGRLRKSFQPVTPAKAA